MTICFTRRGTSQLRPDLVPCAFFVWILSTALLSSCVAAEPTSRLRVLTLADAEHLIASNRDLRLARQLIVGATAGIAQADIRPNPTLSWNAQSISPSGGLGSGDPFHKRIDQIVRIDQTIERGDKRFLRVAVAQIQLDSAEADLQEQRRLSLQILRGAYADLMLAEQRIVVLDETERGYATSLAAAERRIRAGDLSAADLSRLRVDALRAHVDGEQANADRLRAQVVLAKVLAIEGDALNLATDGVWPDPMTDADVDSNEKEGTGRLRNIDRRPDVVSARFAVDATEKSVDLARAQRVRDVTVGVQVERYPGATGTGNSVGIGLSIPLFVGNDFGGDIRRAASDSEVAREVFERVRAQALSDLNRASIDLKTARERSATYRNGLLSAAEQAAQSSDFAFSRGALGVIELMDAHRTLLATRLDALGANADYMKALASSAAARTQLGGKE